MGRRRERPVIAKMPTQDTTGVAMAVQALAREGQKALDPLHKDWRKWYKYRDGNQWDSKYPDRMAINLIYPTCHHAKAVMTETIPEPIYEERLTQDRAKARLMQYEWDLCSDNSRFPLQLTEAVGNAFTYGAGFLRLGWNPHIMDGWGGVLVHSWIPWAVVPDPNGKSERDCQWVIFRRKVSRRALEHEFGRIDDKTWASLALDSPMDQGQAEEQYNQGRYFLPSFAQQYECFLRNGRFDHSQIAPAEEAPWGNRVRYTRIVGGCKLQDGPSPYGPFLPFVRVLTDPLEGEFWGRSRIKQLKDIQDMINRRNHAVNAAFDFGGFPVMFADREADLDKDLKVEPGAVYYKNMGTDVHFDRGPGASAAELGALQQDIALFDRAGMLQAVTQGVRPKGVTSGVALNQLQSAAHAGVRLQMRHVAQAVKDCAEMLPEFLKRFYIRRRPVVIEGIEGWIRGKVFEGSWQVKIDTQPSLPTDSLVQQEQLKQLVEMGALPPSVLFDMTPLVSDAKKGRIREQMTQMSEAQGMAGANAGGPMAGAGAG